MNYFTPQLYVRGQATDSATLDEVERAWEAAERYGEHLQRVHPHLPADLVGLLDRFDLHNADVLAAGRSAEGFVVVVQPDPAAVTLLLTYALADEPVIDREALPPEWRSSRVRWLYDEVGVVEEGRAGVCEQSILLSNGWEVRLRFRDVRVVAVEPLLLADSARRRLDEARRLQGVSAPSTDGHDYARKG